MARIVLIPPTAEPVSLAELKQHLRVDAGDDSQDKTILDEARSARATVEAFARRRLMLQTHRVRLDGFPQWELFLPSPPTRSIVSLSYTDANGGSITMTPDVDYIEDLDSQPARLTPPFGMFWPVTRIEPNCVQIDFTLGYAMELSLSTYGSPANTAMVESSGYSFSSSDIGRPLAISGAGSNGDVLDTEIISIEEDAHIATIRSSAAAAFQGVSATLVNFGDPDHWDICKKAIKMKVADGYHRRLSSTGISNTRTDAAIKDLLYPIRNLQV